MCVHWQGALNAPRERSYGGNQNSQCSDYGNETYTNLTSVTFRQRKPIVSALTCRGNKINSRRHLNDEEDGNGGGRPVGLPVSRLGSVLCSLVALLAPPPPRLLSVDNNCILVNVEIYLIREMDWPYLIHKKWALKDILQLPPLIRINSPDSDGAVKIHWIFGAPLPHCANRV